MMTKLRQPWAPLTLGVKGFRRCQTSAPGLLDHLQDAFHMFENKFCMLDPLRRNLQAGLAGRSVRDNFVIINSRLSAGQHSCYEVGQWGERQKFGEGPGLYACHLAAGVLERYWPMVSEGDRFELFANQPQGISNSLQLDDQSDGMEASQRYFRPCSLSALSTGQPDGANQGANGSNASRPSSPVARLKARQPAGNNITSNKSNYANSSGSVISHKLNYFFHNGIVA
jgi:hypothetical protein